MEDPTSLNTIERWEAFEACSPDDFETVISLKLTSRPNIPLSLILQVLCERLNRGHALRLLDLSGLELGPEGCKQLCVAGIMYNRAVCLNDLQELNMSDNLIRLEGFKSLCRVLPALVSLRSLQLKGNCLGDDELELLMNLIMSVPQLTQLKFLGLSKNSIGTKGCTTLSTFATSSKNELLTLELTGNNFTGEDWKSLCAALPLSTLVDHLSIQNLHSMLHECLRSDLSGNLQLVTELNLTNKMSGWDADAVGLFCAKLRQFIKLEVLNLSANNLGPEGCKILCEVLPSLKSLTKLELSANNLGPDGCRVLCAVFQKLCKLRELDLEANGFNTEEWRLLVASFGSSIKLIGTVDIGLREALGSHSREPKSIKKLDLKNRIKGNYDVSLLKDRLSEFTGLECLTLSVNPLDPEGCNMLFKMLQGLSNLRTLGIDNIGSECCEGLCEVLPQLKNLETLGFDNLRLDGCEKMLQVLPKMSNLCVLGFDDLKGCSYEGLCHMLPGIKTLHTLELGNVNSECCKKICEVLPKMSNLLSLGFENIIGPNGCQTLIKNLMFPERSKLQFFALRRSSLCLDDLKTLCPKLLMMESLQKLDLRSNDLSSKTAEYLLSTLKAHPAVGCEIDLSLNQISNSLLKQINEAISSNRNLSELLKEGELPVTRGRMILCGFAYAGKSTLLSSLSRSRLKKFISNESLKADFDNSGQRTPGIDFVRLSLNGVDLVVLDFGGQPEFYLTHEMFLHDKNTFFVLVCNLLLDSQIRVQQLRFWLRFLQSRFGGGEEGLVQRPDVIIVGTNLDSEEASSNPTKFKAVSDAVPTLFQQECAVLQREFSSLRIHGKTFAVDARKSQSEGVLGLKDYLKQVAIQVMGRQPKFPKCCEPLLKWVEKKRAELEKRKLPPLISWDEYFEEVKTWVNPLITEKQLHRMTSYLTQIGEIVFFPHMPSHVFLSPNWIARDIIGVALASDALKHRIKFEEDGSVIAKKAFPVLMNKMKDITQGLAEPSFCRLIFDLLEQLEICYCSSPNEMYPLEEVFIFPSMMQISMPDIDPLKWTKGDGCVLCFGRRFDCDFITPGIFPHLVIKLRKFFEKFPLIWRGGFQFALPSVECMVECGDVPLASTNMQDCRRFIDVRVRLGRGVALSNEGVLLCHRVMGLVCETVEEVRYMCSPGCTYGPQALSPSLIFEKEMSKRKGYPLDPLLEKKSEEFETEFGVSESVGSIVGLCAKGLTLKEVHAFVHRLNQIHNDARRALRLLREIQQIQAQPAVDVHVVECMQRFEHENAFPPLSAFEELSLCMASSNMPSLLFDLEGEQASRLFNLLKSSLIPLCVGFKLLLLYDQEHGDDRLKTHATKLKDLEENFCGLEDAQKRLENTVIRLTKANRKKDESEKLEVKQKEHENELNLHKESISSMNNVLLTHATKLKDLEKDVSGLKHDQVLLETALVKHLQFHESLSDADEEGLGESLMGSHSTFGDPSTPETNRVSTSSSQNSLSRCSRFLGKGRMSLEQGDNEIALRVRHFLNNEKFIVPCLGLEMLPVDPPLYQLAFAAPVVSECSLHSILHLLHAREGCYKPVKDMDAIKEHMNRELLSPQDVLTVALQCIEAVEYVHTQHFIITNFGCDSFHFYNGRFKLSDLSAAVSTRDVPSKHWFLHCPKESNPDMHHRARYVAPEFVGIKREHDPKDPDMLAKETGRGDAYMTQLIDVFGFGVLLWELLFEHPLVEITPKCFDIHHAVGGTHGRLRIWQADPFGKALIRIAQDCLKGAPERIYRPTASDVKKRLMELCVSGDSLSLSEKFMKGVNEKLSLPEVTKTLIEEDD